MVSLTFLIIASLLQGLLEWLPVSSEGQNVLVLISLAGDPDQALSIALFLHLGTGFAALFYYRHLIYKIVTTRSPNQTTGDLRRILFFTTIGTGITGFILYNYLVDLIGVTSGSLFMSLIGIFLIITAGILYISKKMGGQRKFHDLSNVEALIIGLIQGFAVIPGISRSGLTIGALLMLRADQDEALFGSFLMSIPATFGVVALEAVTETLPSLLLWQIVLTLSLTCVIGYLSMNGLLRISKKINFPIFLLILGVIAVLLNIPY